MQIQVKYKDNSKKVNTNIIQAVDVSVSKAILIMERNIKVNTPIKTGTLARSITSKKTGKGEGEVNTSQVAGGKNLNYAVFVEYGTKNMAPRAMFRKGVAQSEDRIQQIFVEELSK